MHTLVGFLTAVLSPVLGIVSSVISLIRRRKPSFFGFSVSVSLIYSFFPLLWDARNNFLLLTYYGGVSFSPYVKIIDYMMDSLSFQYMSVIFIFGALITYFLSRVIIGQLIVRRDHGVQYYYLCLALFFMTIEYRAVFDIQKTTLALALFVVALNTENLIKRWGCVALAIAAHPFVAALAILLLAARLLDRLGRRVLVALFFIAILIVAASVDVISMLATFMSERVQLYAGLEQSRFSSAAIAQLIWLLRLFGIITVAVVSIQNLKSCNNRRERILLNTLVATCLVALVVSRNEVFVERFFLAVVVLTAYTAAVVRFRVKALAVAVFALGLNVALHGGYTLLLVFSPAYNVMGSVNDRTDDAMRLLYYPTLMLLDYADSPRSDDAISRGVAR